MQFEEETLEILEPNAAMSPILKALDAACGEFQENEVLRVDPDLAAFDG